ncbi:HPF/RaiA family ribosome-associated protein [Haliangium sp.]|uniref:HPF/RaiA family ribosome-associated protein n=1 Tax=Haliangium sp. TaxID=2663208 RepID=UPI003D0C4D5B
MTFPIQVTFRGMQTSEALEAEVRSKAQDLEKYFDRILNCRTTVEAPSKHHRHGQHFHVTVELSVPGHELVASRGEGLGHEDPGLAIRDAFRAAKSELQRHVGRIREQEKHGPRITDELSGS